MICFGLMFLAPTLLLWVGVTAISRDQTGGDAAGNAMARGFAALWCIALWVLLAILLLIGGGHGGMPSPWCWLAIPLVPVSGVAAVKTLEVMAKGWHLKWPIIYLIAVPGLMIVYSVWCFFPSLHEKIAATIAGSTTWIGTAVMLAVPVMGRLQIEAKEAARPRKTPAEIAEEQRLAAEEEKRRTAEYFASLNENSMLQEWLMYAERPEYRAAAWEGARRSKSRQEDVLVVLPNASKDVFMKLPQLDLQVTPELTAAMRAYLLDKVKLLMPYTPEGTNTTKVVTDWYSDYLPALEWMIDRGGKCDEELVALEEAVKGYPDTEDRRGFLERVEGLRGKQRLAGS